MLKAWFGSKDLLTKLNPATTFAWCERTLEAWTEDGGYKLGVVDKPTKQWIWLVENCRIAEIKIPTHMMGDDQEDCEAPSADGPREVDEAPQENETEEDQEMDVPPGQPEGGVLRGSETQTPAGSAPKTARVLKASASAPPTPGPAAEPDAPEAQQGAPHTS